MSATARRPPRAGALAAAVSLALTGCPEDEPPAEDPAATDLDEDATADD